MSIIKKGVLATTLVASAIATTASPALAHDRYYRHHDNTAGVAIGAGILGLAVGAIVASSNNDRHRHDRYYDRRYYRDGHYYNNRYYPRDWRSDYRYDRYDYRGSYNDRYYSRRGY